MSDSGDDVLDDPPPPPGLDESAEAKPLPPGLDPSTEITEETQEKKESPEKEEVEKEKKKKKAKDSSKDRSKSKSKGRSKERSKKSKDRDRSRGRSGGRSGRRRRRRSRSRDRGRGRRRRSRSRDRGRRRRSGSRTRRRKRKRSPSPESVRKVKKEEPTAPPPPAVVKTEPKAPEITEEEKKRREKEQEQQLLEAQIKAASEFANLGVNAEITRPARKLYVGNLPTDLGLTEKMLVQFFTACLKGLGLMTDIPIMSAWINGDQTFAFLEFRSVQDATLALSLCDGLTLGGRQLRFGRPVDYKLPAKHLLCYTVGGQEPVGDAEMPYTMPKVKEDTPAFTLAKALMRQETGEDPTGNPHLILAPPKRKDQSRVLLLENCVTESMILKNEDYLDIIEDIKEECDQWGKLLQIVVPRRGQDACGFNRVFLRFEKQSGADRCKLKTNGREFADSDSVKVHYFSELHFKGGEWDAEPLKPLPKKKKKQEGEEGDEEEENGEENEVEEEIVEAPEGEDVLEGMEPVHAGAAAVRGPPPPEPPAQESEI